jgi:hypothetical protein
MLTGKKISVIFSLLLLKGGIFMRKRIFLILFIFSFVIFLSNCTKSEKKLSVEDVNNLISKINNSPLGLKLEVDSKNIITKLEKKSEKGKDRYLVTLVQPSVIFDTSVYKSMDPNLKPTKIAIGMKELNLVYGHSEEYLSIASIKGLSFDWNPIKMLKQPVKARKIKSKIKVSAENIELKDYDYSCLLRKDPKDFIGIISDLINDNPLSESICNNIKFEMEFLDKDKKKRVFVCEIGEAEGMSKVKSDFFAIFLKKKETKLNLLKLLSEGSPIFEVKMKLSDVFFEAKEEDKDIFKGKIENSSFSYYLRPDNTKSFFEYGNSFSIKNVNVSVPENKEIELATKIEGLQMAFSMEHLTPEFVQSYLDLIEASISKKYSGEKDKQRTLAAQGMKIGGEFIKSKPIIKIFFPEFIHYFGELNANAEFQFSTIGPPQGKAIVRIFKIDEVIKRIKSEKLFSSKIIQGILKIFKDTFVKDKEHDGVLTFEIKKEEPRVFYLNDKPLNLNKQNR